MHGFAGSAAIVLLTIQSTELDYVRIIYIGLFGLGTIVGIRHLSIVIAVPLRDMADYMT